MEKNVVREKPNEDILVQKWMCHSSLKCPSFMRTMPLFPDAVRPPGKWLGCLNCGFTLVS